MKSHVKVSRKKVYEAPKLLKYASLTEMTAGSHLRGMPDAPSATTRTG
jgi:hypothetical protein